MIANTKKKPYVIRYILLFITVLHLAGFLWMYMHYKEGEKYLNNTPVTEVTSNLPYETNLLIHGTVKSDSSVSDKPWTGDDEFVCLVKTYTIDTFYEENKTEYHKNEKRVVDRKTLKTGNIKLGSYDLAIDDFGMDSMPSYLIEDEYREISDYLEKTNDYYYFGDMAQQYYFTYNGLLQNQKIYVMGKLNRDNVIVPHGRGTILTEGDYENYRSGFYNLIIKTIIAILLFFVVQLTTSIMQSKFYGKSIMISILRFAFACTLSALVIEIF
ncbi:hypothetical protein [Wukongibacter baidiensis]